MTNEEKDRKAYERYKRYRNAKWKYEHESIPVVILVIVVIVVIMAWKLGLHL
jgi:hypothetical protein